MKTLIAITVVALTGFASSSQLAAQAEPCCPQCTCEVCIDCPNCCEDCECE